MSVCEHQRRAMRSSEYYVTVTLRIPHRLLGRITKKSIQSKDVEIVAADWDRVREIYSPNTIRRGAASASSGETGSQEITQ